MAEIELWLVDLEGAAEALEIHERATPRLSDDIRRRLDAMRDQDARRERRLSHIALRILLECHLGPAIRCEPFFANASGKPSLETHDIHFSLAHTQGLALVALGSAGPLGIDIERVRPVRIPDARRAPIEAGAVALALGEPLLDTDRDQRFLNAWVRIEAVAKAHGSGVAPLLERWRPGTGRGELAGDEALSVVASDIPMQRGVFAAVALPCGVKPPVVRALPHTEQGLAALLEGGNGRR